MQGGKFVATRNPSYTYCHPSRTTVAVTSPSP